MNKLHKGFTLIELMIVVALIGVLSAIALPAYQEYSVRAKVSEFLLQMASYRTTVTEKAQTDSTLANAGSGLTVNVIGKISGGSISQAGTIVLTGAHAATSTGVAVTVTMIPTMTGGTVTWACLGTPSKYFPAMCR